jgi:hypothetical protein
MMKTTIINKKRLLLAVQTTLKSGAALLLVILLLGMLGLWSLIPALLVMAVFLSLSVLMFLTMHDFTLVSIYPIYSMRVSLLDSYSSHTQEEDFTPFVFKDQTPRNTEQA